MQKGTVKWFDPKKRYGFITKEDGEDVFVHASSIEGKKFRSPCKGDKVAFSIVNDRKGTAAVGVTVQERGVGNRRERENGKGRKDKRKYQYEWKSIKKRNNGTSKSSARFTQGVSELDVKFIVRRHPGYNQDVQA